MFEGTVRPVAGQQRNHPIFPVYRDESDGHPRKGRLVAETLLGRPSSWASVPFQLAFVPQELTELHS